MSYEVDNIKETKCPCGKGKIQLISESNDWFQTRENFKIQCSECFTKYEVISEYFCPKPKNDFKIYYCKDKKTGEKIKLDL